MNIISKHFPTYGEKNIVLFYLVTLFGSTLFMIANWLLFILFFMNASDFSIFESIAFGAGVLLEIPSGAIADLLGKRRTVIFAFAMQFLGAILFMFASKGAVVIFIANILGVSSYAIKSGSLEALVYDTLLQSKKEKHFDDVLGKSHSIMMISMVFASIIGGIAWKYSTYAPWFMSAMGFLLACVLSFAFVEPKIDSEVFSWKNFVKQNRLGFHYLFKSDFRKYTFPMIALSGTYLMWEVGFIKILMGESFGYDGESLGYLVSGSLVLSLLASYQFRKIRKKFGNLKGYGLLILLSSLAWLATGILTRSMILGAIVFSALTLAGSLSEIWSSVILNTHVKSKDRATALSTMSFLVQIPYVFVVIAYGRLIANGSVNTFYILTGCVLIIALYLFYRAEKQKVIVE